MATSGSRDFTLVRDEIITDAYEYVHVKEEGQSLTAEQTELASRTLESMIKALQVDGLFLWTWADATLFLKKDQRIYSLYSSGDHATESYVQTTLSADATAGAGTVSLTSTTGMTNNDNIGIVLDSGSIHWTTITNVGTGALGAVMPSAATSGNTVYAYTTKIPRPIEIDPDIILRNSSNIDRPIHKITENEYLLLPSKFSTGAPVQAYCKKLRDRQDMYVWLVPGGSTDKAIFSYKKAIEDFDLDENNADFPVEWLEYLGLALAYRLAPKFSIPLAEQQILKLRMDEAREALNDNEGGSFFFQPDMRR